MVSVPEVMGLQWSCNVSVPEVTGFQWSFTVSVPEVTLHPVELYGDRPLSGVVLSVFLR